MMGGVGMRCPNMMFLVIYMTMMICFDLKDK